MAKNRFFHFKFFMYLLAINPHVYEAKQEHYGVNDLLSGAVFLVENINKVCGCNHKL